MLIVYIRISNFFEGYLMGTNGYYILKSLQYIIINDAYLNEDNHANFLQ